MGLEQFSCCREIWSLHADCTVSAGMDLGRLQLNAHHCPPLASLRKLLDTYTTHQVTIQRFAETARMALEKLKRRVGFIGAGQMAEALARGFISKGVLDASDIVATDPVAARKEVFQSFDVKAVNSNVEV